MKNILFTFFVILFSDLGYCGGMDGGGGGEKPSRILELSTFGGAEGGSGGERPSLSQLGAAEIEFLRLTSPGLQEVQNDLEIQ